MRSSDPAVKCGGWGIAAGSVRCGTSYRPGSYLCGTCANRFYPYGDGSCAACPLILSAWDRFRGVIMLLAGVAVAAACVGALLVTLVKVAGGTLVGSVSLLAGLVQWSILAVQTVSQAAPVSAASLPPFLATLFRGLSVLQLDGVLLPPACTGAYAFESQARVLSAALGLALVYLGIMLTGSRAPARLLTAGALIVRALLLLFSPASRDALALLYCTAIEVTSVGAASLDGGPVPAAPTSTTWRSRGIGSITSVRVLFSDPYYVCWSAGGPHLSAGALAVATLFVSVLVVPCVTLAALFPERGSRLQLSSAAVTKVSHTCGSIVSADADAAARDVTSTFAENPMMRGRVGPASVASPLAAGVGEAKWALLVPFISDYRAGAWYTRHVDLSLALLLSTLEALVPAPLSTAALAGKAAVSIAATLGVALHVLVARPFAPQHAWKGPVRAAILVLAAACAVVNGWARALDLGVVRSTGATQALHVGAYVLLALYISVLALLLGGISRALLRGLRAEQVAMREASTLHSVLSTSAAPNVVRVSMSGQPLVPQIQQQPLRRFVASAATSGADLSALAPTAVLAQTAVLDTRIERGPSTQTQGRFGSQTSRRARPAGSGLAQ